MPSRALTIAIVLGCTIILGVVAGTLGNFGGLPPAVMFAIIMPLAWRLLIGRRRKSTSNEPAKAVQVLFEGSNTRGRVVQSLLPLIGTVVGAIGVTMLVRAGGGFGAASVVTTIAGALLIVLPLRTVIGWDVSYKGHTIRFENDPCFGERLLIDGQVVDRGGVGLDMVLLGTIASGEGAGDVIRATSFAGIPTFRCRIVAESPGPAARLRAERFGEVAP
jgi:hypothetical protein